MEALHPCSFHGEVASRARLADVWELRLVDEPVMDGVEGQLEPVGNAELVEDIVQMVLDGLLADEHLLGDFLITEALADQPHYFPFTR